jgi:hypothetical protein
MAQHTERERLHRGVRGFAGGASIRAWRRTWESERPGLKLWASWVGANAAGELIGLGVSARVVWTAMSYLSSTGRDKGLTEQIVAAVVMVAAGALVEGFAVGTAQWLVLRRVFWLVGRGQWVFATAVGAGIAWLLGVIPSTLMSFGEQGGEAAATAPDMSGPLTLALAALMGIVLGPVLGLPQWLVLRNYVSRAGWWVPAQSAAWALGMPLVFLAAGSIPDGTPLPVVVVLVVGTLALAGAVVGAVHGIALVYLARRRAANAEDI